MRECLRYAQHVCVCVCVCVCLCLCVFVYECKSLCVRERERECLLVTVVGCASTSVLQILDETTKLRCVLA